MVVASMVELRKEDFRDNLDAYDRGYLDGYRDALDENTKLSEYEKSGIMEEIAWDNERAGYE